MRIRHPEHVVMLLGFVLMITTAVLHILGFVLEKPQLLSWGRWACVALVATITTPLLVGLLFDVIEKLRKKPHD
jgi:hypothetical protein